MELKIYRTKTYGNVAVLSTFPQERLNILNIISESTVQFKTLTLVDKFVKAQSKHCIPVLQELSKKDKKLTPEQFVKHKERVFKEVQTFIDEYNLKKAQKLEKTETETEDYNPSSISDDFKKPIKLEPITDPVGKVETAKNPIKLEPMSTPVDGTLTTAKEINYIRQYINQYLRALGLKALHTNLPQDDLVTIATKGDALLNVAILERTENHLFLNPLRSNINMKLAMIKLGFIDFYNVNDHLAGTFFETIYYCAYVQKSPVTDRLLNALISDIQIIQSENLFVEN